MVLAGLQDPGNLGTILRSAEAFGATGVLSLPGTVSAWNPKAVRASAGSVFRVPLLAASAEECFARLREAGVKILGPPPCAEPKPADLANLAGAGRAAHRQRGQRRAGGAGRTGRRRDHDSLPRPGGEPERGRRGQRAALRSLAAALEEYGPMSLFDGEPR